MSHSSIRLQAVHKQLQDQLEAAIAYHDTHDRYFLRRPLYDAIVDFSRELDVIAGIDEISRHADVCRNRTGEGTHYAETLIAISEARANRSLPFLAYRAIQRGQAPHLPSIESVRAELKAVRQMLGDNSLDLQTNQRELLERWERELVLIEREAEELQSTDCEWLRFVRDKGRTIDDEDENHVVGDMYDGEVLNLQKTALVQMKEAAQSLVDSVAANPKPPSPRISVDIACGKIFVDGKGYDADSHWCTAIQALVDEGGKNLTGPQLRELHGCGGKKWSREFDSLKKKIPALVDRLVSDGNKGYRILDF